MRMEQSTPIYDPQKVALDKLTTVLDPEYVEFIVSQCPDVLNARLKNFMQYETNLVGQVQEQMVSTMPTRFVSMSNDGANPQPVKLKKSLTLGKKKRISSSGSAG